jgi:putative CocE/NonD family hydrolase
VYHPVGAKGSPTILVRIPFSSTFYNRLAADGVARFWASRGYTAVVQGTRGRYKSGGAYYPLRHEHDDGLETLRWLAQQPWFDGRLGMWGGSAFGYTQWVLADRRDPGPSALMIQIASTSFGETFHPGGAFALESALFWAVRSRGARDDLPDFETLERGFVGFPLIDADERAAGQDIAFFDDWATHAPGDAYWTQIDGERRASALRAPTLLMAGWYDPFLVTQLRDYAEIRAHADPEVARELRLVVGPWTHADALILPDGTPAEAYRPASLAPSIAWFDHHLLGRPLDPSLAAPVRIFVLGENVWRDEQEWPLARAEYRALYLRSGGHANSRSGDGQLDFSPPGTVEPPDRFVFDPERPVPSRGGAMLGPRAGIREQREVEARDDVLVYTSEPLERELEVTGPLEALLHVTTSAPSTDFTVKLVDVHPDGAAYNVSEGILRRAYRPDAEPEEIRIELSPTSMLFRKGHRIRVEVSSSSFPRYDRNPNTGREIATETTPSVARQAVHHGAGAPSRIVLPVVPR